MDSTNLWMYLRASPGRHEQRVKSAQSSHTSSPHALCGCEYSGGKGMKYRRFHFQWKIVRLAALAAAAVLLAPGMLAAVLDRTSAARTVTAPHKAAALPRAEATGFAGLNGGNGSG